MDKFDYQYEIYYMIVGYQNSMQPCETNIEAKLVDFRTQESMARVSFDYQYVIDWEDKYGNVIGFFHTHPKGCAGPSGTDIRTMTGWCQCLGKDLLCVIDCGTSVVAIPFRFNAEKGRVKQDADVSDYVYFKHLSEKTPYIGDNIMLPKNDETITLIGMPCQEEKIVTIEKEEIKKPEPPANRLIKEGQDPVLEQVVKENG